METHRITGCVWTPLATYLAHECASQRRRDLKCYDCKTLLATKLPMPRVVAKAFTKVLKDWLTPEQFKAVRVRNAIEPHAGICHSHDFCDANNAMDVALKTCGIRWDVNDSGLWTLRDAAWNLAATKYLGATK